MTVHDNLTESYIETVYKFDNPQAVIIMRKSEIENVLNMIRALERLEMGDLSRLVRINNRILNMDIRQDDICYVRNAFSNIHDWKKKTASVQIKQSNRLWYLLPIFLSLVGGIISYVCLRKKDPICACNTLMLGFILFGIFVTIIVAAYVTSDSVVQNIGPDANRSYNDYMITQTEPDPSVNKISNDVLDKDTISGTNSLILEADMNVDNPIESIDNVSNTETIPRQYKLHTISYAEIPDYADSDAVLSAREYAIHSWESSNSFLDFEIVESDADLNIEWEKWMLGAHTVFDTTSGGDMYNRIAIRLGNDDCHSVYQPYSTESLRHTIAHELGHYLELRHIDNRDHLMHSEDFFNTDSASIYDNKGYVVPKITNPEILTQNGKNILLQIESTEEILNKIAVERNQIKGNVDPDQEALLSNAVRYNEIVHKLNNLYKDLKCSEIADLYK